MHREAEQCTTSAYDLAWGLIAERIRTGGTIRETEVQAAIMDHFQRHGMTTYSPPIVGSRPAQRRPALRAGCRQGRRDRAGRFVLIDLWCKLDKPRAVYSDLTRVGFTGKTVPEKYERIFAIVARARDAAVACVRAAYAAGRPLQGWEVDDACRKVIVDAGYGEYFIHRTGHNIGQEVHGNGANMDNLETHEQRLVLRRTCFSVEPGIYQAEFGVRSEINVFVDAAGEVHVTGGLQEKVVPILAIGRAPPYALPTCHVAAPDLALTTGGRTEKRAGIAELSPRSIGRPARGSPRANGDIETRTPGWRSNSRGKRRVASCLELLVDTTSGGIQTPGQDIGLDTPVPLIGQEILEPLRETVKFLSRHRQRGSRLAKGVATA